MANKFNEVDFLTALKKIVDGADGVDIFIFVILLLVIPPLPIIWLIVRLIQEMN